MRAPDRPPFGLDALEAWLRQNLERLKLPATSWALSRQAGGMPVADIAIMGGGVCGLAGVPA